MTSVVTTAIWDIVFVWILTFCILSSEYMYLCHLDISSSFLSSDKRARSQPRACQRTKGTKGTPASGYYVDLWLIACIPRTQNIHQDTIGCKIIQTCCCFLWTKHYFSAPGVSGKVATNIIAVQYQPLGRGGRDSLNVTKFLVRLKVSKFEKRTC